MTSREQPPQPPEQYNNRRLAIGILAYLAAYKKPVTSETPATVEESQEKDSAVLLHAPVHHLPDEVTLATLSLPDISKLYNVLKRVLLCDLEKTADNDLFGFVWDMERWSAKSAKGHDLDMLHVLSDIILHQPRNFIEALVKKTEPIQDKSFFKRFGYNYLVRGMGDDVLTLFESTPEGLGENHPIYLGMTVRFRKKTYKYEKGHPLADTRIKAPGTGPLEGTGKIIGIDIPNEGAVFDRVITLLVNDKGTPTETFLSIDELML